MIIPIVVVYIHPIDTSKNASLPIGYRWAVHVGGQQPSDLTYCVGAGHESTRNLADLVGQSHGAAACKALRIMGLQVGYNVIYLETDPLPVGAEHAPLAHLRSGS